MFRLKVTAERRGNKIVAINREIMDELEDDPHYWDAICNLLLTRMEHDGLLGLHEQGGDMATTA
jgi:hypothetical protein